LTTAKALNFFSTLLLWQDGHSTAVSERISLSNDFPQPRQTYSKMGMVKTPCVGESTLFQNKIQAKLIFGAGQTHLTFLSYICGVGEQFLPVFVIEEQDERKFITINCAAPLSFRRAARAKIYNDQLCEEKSFCRKISP
jgi:hypothetical protein